MLRTGSLQAAEDDLVDPVRLPLPVTCGVPSQVIDGREGLTPVFEDLNRYQATHHFNGQSTVVLGGDRATGESYCIAHHLFTDDGVRKLMLAHLRYDDAFVKRDGAWLFAERKLYVDWLETRASHP